MDFSPYPKDFFGRAYEVGSQYREWKEIDGSVSHVLEMPDCCQRAIGAVMWFDAESTCANCGTFWRAV